MKRTVLAVLVLGLAVLLVACGGSDDDGGGAASGDGGGEPAQETLKVTWLYTGPVNDGGYNEGVGTGMRAMEDIPGVEVNAIDDLPYSQQTTKVIRQAIATGSNVIVDTLGLSNLLTDACRQAPEVKCYAVTDPVEQPPNSRAFWPEEWNLGFVGGQAAGLMTKSNTVGFIGPTQIPISVAGLNSFALGCQSVNPDCKVRAIFINNFFDPPKAAQAANTLIDAGADVLRNYVDDPSFCEVAARRGAYAVGLWNDFSGDCPDSIITSTVWDVSDYFVQQIEDIRAGRFEGSGTQPDFIPVGDAEGQSRLGEWGDFVPDDVRTKVEATYQSILDGENVIKGPIYDNKGKLRFKEGEEPDKMFLMAGWDWFVEGVQAGK